MSGRVARRIRVSGRVQGVFFRDWTVAEATRLGLDGWVRNRADGSVEMLVAGTAEAIDALTALCRRGPPAARVDAVGIEDADTDVPPGFRRARTE